MTLHDQLINDIKQLPDDILRDLSGVVKKILILNNKAISAGTYFDTSSVNNTKFAKLYPLLGCAEGKVRMADDFNSPLEEMEDYM
jgi:hypothetical protein